MTVRAHSRSYHNILERLRCAGVKLAWDSGEASHSTNLNVNSNFVTVLIRKLFNRKRWVGLQLCCEKNVSQQKKFCPK
jgi:hypothetical protein